MIESWFWTLSRHLKEKSRVQNKVFLTKVLTLKSLYWSSCAPSITQQRAFDVEDDDEVQEDDEDVMMKEGADMLTFGKTNLITGGH